MPRTRVALHPYVTSTNKLKLFFSDQILGREPPVVTQTFLQALDFAVAAEYDQLLNLLFDLGFIDSEDRPTDHYRSYRTHDNSRQQLMGHRVRVAYTDLFDAHPDAGTREKEAIIRYFTLEHENRGITIEDATIRYMANTFTALCKFCDFEADPHVLELLRRLRQTCTAVSTNHQELLRQMTTPVPDFAFSESYELLLHQAISCFSVDAYRAAILAAWAALSHYAHEYLCTDNLHRLTQLSDHYRFHGRVIPWSSIVSLQNLIDDWSDAFTIDAINSIHDARFGREIAVRADLHIQRGLRNRYTHQTDRETTHPDALSFLNATMDLLVTLSEQRVRQFT